VVAQLPILGIIAFGVVVILVAIRHPADWSPDWRPERMKLGTRIVPIRRNALIAIGIVGIITASVMLALSFTDGP
jgi:hypothetical protein